MISRAFVKSARVVPRAAWVFLAAGTMVLGRPAHAGDRPPPYNTVELQAEVQREVANDLMHAILAVELNDRDPAALSDRINRTVNEALRTAAAFPAVRTRSGPQRTFPVYDRNNAPSGWRGRAEIRLESTDFLAASQLLGKLQASLQIASLHFSLSPEARWTVESELMSEAVAAFSKRATIVQKALGGSGYKLRRLQISGSGDVPQPRFSVMRAAPAQAVTPPDLEAGFSRVVINATGSIEVTGR